MNENYLLASSSSNVLMDYGLVTLLFILFITFMYITNKIVIRLKEKANKTESLIKGLRVEDQIKFEKTEKRNKFKNNLLTKKYPFKKILSEYHFFGGEYKSLIIKLSVGFVSSFLIYFILTKNFLLSLIFSFLFFLLFYNRIDGMNKKMRMSYLKSFASSLEIISSGLEAGNSLETSFLSIQKKETLNAKIIKEFAILNNHLKSGASLNDALDKFWDRNKMYDEFAMFVIILQFSAKDGGAGLKKIFLTMKASLTTKVENYSLIESKISSYKMMFKIFTMLGIGATLFGNFFMPGMYEHLSTPIGYAQALGGIVVIFLANFLFNGMIRSAAEA